MKISALEKLMSRAALNVTSSDPGKWFLQHEDVEHLLGLDGLGALEASPNGHAITLSDGKVDPRTGGMVALRSDIEIDAENRIKKLNVSYLVVQPNGRHAVHKLAEINFGGRGKTRKPRTLTFLGRAIDPDRIDHAMRVYGALERIHTSIRNMEFPEVAQIIGDYGISELIGERLLVPGMDKKGGFNFEPVYDNAERLDAIQVPQEFLPALLGIGQNDLDPAYEFGDGKTKLEINRQNGAIFSFTAGQKHNAKGGRLGALIRPINGKDGDVTEMADIGWTVKNGLASIDDFRLMGEESGALPPDKRQQRLGVVNQAMRQLRKREYPRLLDALAEYDQRGIINGLTFAAEVDEHRQMFVVPFGGHNEREYLPGFGGTIGGNCKGIFTARRDEKGRVRIKGLLVDLGITFNKSENIQNSEYGNWHYALPDVVDYLPYCDDLLATHLHADHLDGYVDYAGRGLIVGKTFHAAPFVCRVYEQKLKKAKVPAALWPKINALSEQALIHINDGDERALSFYAGVDAIPHSTDNSAYFVFAPPYAVDADGKPLNDAVMPNPHYWVYGGFGDMSFGRYNLPGYDGAKPPDTGLDFDLFKKFRKSLKGAYPQAKDMGVHLVECDPTSIHRDGFAPDVADVSDTLDFLNEVFEDKGLIILGLSTAKRQDEMHMRFAVRSQRNLSIYGAYKEDRFTDMSVMGVNRRVLTPNPDGGNVQAYLDWYAGINELSPVTYYRRTSKEWREERLQDPKSVLILGTGSQNTAIEKDAFGTQLAEFRSLLQRDPKYRTTAAGIDVRDYVILNAQGAIPGNEDTQYALIKKLAFNHNVMVGVSVHRGTRFANLDDEHYKRMIDGLERRGIPYMTEPENGIYVHKLPLYPPGHGWREDYRQGFFPWFKKNGVRMVAAQHFGRMESPQILHEVAKASGLRCPDRVVPNHVIYTMRNQGKRMEVVAQLPPSFILARQNRRGDKYHGGTLEYKRIGVASAEPGLIDAGLFPANNRVYTHDFGEHDYDKTHTAPRILLPVRNRRDVEPALTVLPPSLDTRTNLVTAGMQIPRMPRHDHLEIV